VEAVESAGVFAGAANKVIDMLKDSAENLGQLTKIEVVTQAQVDVFMNGLKLVIDRILAMTAVIDSVTLQRAFTFADMAKKVVESIKTGVKAFMDLGKWDEGTEKDPAETATIFTRFTVAFNSIVSQIFAWLPPKTEPIGKEMLMGMAKGITDNTSLLVTALVAAVNAAIAAARTALGIASPSAVVAELVGVPIAEGIMAGIEAKALAISSTAASTAGRAINTVRQTVTNFELNASYRVQDERSLRDDVTMLQMLKARPT
jgi:hypothetical protein